jgi:hypothetical protein
VIGACDHGERVERCVEPGLVLLAGEHERGTDRVPVLGVGALGVAGIGHDHCLGQVDTGIGEPDLAWTASR